MKRIPLKLTAIAAAIAIIFTIGTKKVVDADAAATISSFPTDLIYTPNYANSLEVNDIVVAGSKGTLKTVSLSNYNNTANTVLITADMSKGNDPTKTTTMYEVGEFLSKFDTTVCSSYTFTDDQKDALVYHINSGMLTAAQVERAQMFVNYYNATGLMNVANFPVKKDAGLLVAIATIGISSLFAASFLSSKKKQEN